MSGASEASQRLYLLGVGGPEDASGVGKVESFRFRYAVIEREGEPATALAFTQMPHLIRFTRALNDAQPFTVPTEAMDTGGNALPPVDGLRVAVDPDPKVVTGWLRDGAQIEERAVPDWETKAP